MMTQRRRDQLQRDLALVKLGHARAYIVELEELLRSMEPVLSDKSWSTLKRVFVSAREDYTGNNKIMSEYLRISPTAVGRFTQRTYKPYESQARPIIMGLLTLFNSFVNQFEKDERSILPPGWKKIPPSDELCRSLKDALSGLHDRLRGSNSLLSSGAMSGDEHRDLMQHIGLVVSLLESKLIELSVLVSLSSRLRDLDRLIEDKETSVALHAQETSDIIDGFVFNILNA